MKMCKGKIKAGQGGKKRHLLKNMLDSIGLRKKMIMIYVCAIVIPVITGGTFYFRRTGKIAKEQAREQLVTEVSQYMQELDAVFFSVEEISGLVSYDMELNDMINKEYASLLEVRDVYARLWNQYVNIIGSWPYVRNVTVYLQNDQIRTDHPYVIRMDDYLSGAEELELITGNRGAGYWSGIRSVEENKEYWYPGNQNMISQTPQKAIAYSRIMGSSYRADVEPNILVIEIDEERLIKRINLSATNHGIFLLDAMGELVIATDSYEQLEQLPGFETMRPLSADWDMTVLEDGKQIAVYGTLGNGWRLVGSMSLAEAMEPQKEMVFTGALFLIGSTILSAALIMLFSTSYANRVGKMAEKMEHFMDGSFQLDSSIGGTDEIGQIDARFDQLAGQLKEIIQEKYVLTLQRERARLDVLQTQVNPHFLYNALSTISWLARKDNSETTSHAVESLAKFYQINLSKGKDLITLASEMECLENYLEIQKLRYPGRIFVYYDLDPCLFDVMIPKLTVQALVENCIQHGMAGQKETISIGIRSERQGDRAYVMIQDDGLGMSPEQLDALKNGMVKSAKGNGIGYINIHRRISMRFGDVYGLTVSSVEGTGTTVTVCLPLEAGKAAE